MLVFDVFLRCIFGCVFRFIFGCILRTQRLAQTRSISGKHNTLVFLWFTAILSSHSCRCPRERQPNDQEGSKNETLRGLCGNDDKVPATCVCLAQPPAFIHFFETVTYKQKWMKMNLSKNRSKLVWFNFLKLLKI